MILEKQVVAIIEDKEQEVLQQGKVPTTIILSPTAYTMLKDEMGIDVLGDVTSFRGMEVAVKFTEEGNSVKVL